MKKRVLPVLLVLIIAAAGAWTWRKAHTGPKLNFGTEAGAGQVLAEELSVLLKAGGEVVIITQDTARYPNEALDAEVKSFQTLLGGSKGIKVAPLELIPLPPLGAPVSRAQLEKVLAEHPQAAAMVSFMGFPNTPVSTLSLPGAKPVFAAVFNSPSPQEAGQIRKALGLDVVIAARYGGDLPVAAGGTDRRARFKADFTLSKPD